MNSNLTHLLLTTMDYADFDLLNDEIQSIPTILDFMGFILQCKDKRKTAGILSCTAVTAGRLDLSYVC